MSAQKLKEFWISEATIENKYYEDVILDRLPTDNYNRDNWIHVIEKSAYDKLQTQAWKAQEISLKLFEALKLQQDFHNDIMKKGSIDWGKTFDIDFGLMNEAFLELDKALLEFENFKKEIK